MSPSRARSASYVPEFDPYGYSPFDPDYQGADTNRGYDYDGDHSDDEDRKHSSRDHHHDNSHRTRHHHHSSPSSRRRSSRDAGGDDDGDDHHRHGRRHNSPNTGRKRSSSAKVKSDSHHNKDDHVDDDDQWDTDYDPRDKYYLSGDERDYEYLSPTRAYQRENYQPHKALADRDSRRRRGGGDSRSSSNNNNNTNSSGSGRRGLARRESTESTTAGRRSGSGGVSRPSRPRAVSRYSSYGSSSKARSRYPPNASRSKAVVPKPVEKIPWEQLARCAVKAGAIAALKVHNQPGSWIGEKGTKVASAALGAAVVDTFLSKKHPKKAGGVRHAAMRQVAEMAIGNMVAGPAMKRGGRLKR